MPINRVSYSVDVTHVMLADIYYVQCKYHRLIQNGVIFYQMGYVIQSLNGVEAIHVKTELRVLMVLLDSLVTVGVARDLLADTAKQNHSRQILITLFIINCIFNYN